MIKTIQIFAVLSVSSLLTMVIVDYFLGPKAEFINAWSVIERLLGRPPSGGNSVVFLHFGAVGELICAGLINLAVGGVLTLLLRMLVRR